MNCKHTFTLHVMRNIAYLLLSIPIYVIMALPFRICYVLSDLLYLIAFYVVRYRRKVVHENLTNAFPEKSTIEIDQLARKYTSFMVDVFIETFKLLTLSRAQLRKRVVFTNTELVDRFRKSGRSVIIVLGHQGNWEWSGQAFEIQGIFHNQVSYHPLSSPFFDWLMFRLRSRFGMKLVPMQNVLKEMVNTRNQLIATALIADQTPSNKEAAYWMTFLNQDTPVFLGTEKIARKFNQPVIFANLTRLKRGYYTCAFELITEHPQQEPEHWITEQHTRMLEMNILRQPETWLWSHRRWKHKRPNA